MSQSDQTRDQNLLNDLGINKSIKGKDEPNKFIAVKYGKTAAKSTIPNKNDVPHKQNDEMLPPERAKRIQSIFGSCLYYARAVNSTIICTVSKIASAQANPTLAVEQAADHLLAYLSKYPNAGMIIKTSNMILKIYTNASYLTETNSRSRIAVYLHLTRETEPDFIKAPVQHSTSIRN
jgi:hypothetical protein